MHSTRNNGGHSILETLTVLAVTTLLSALSAPFAIETVRAGRLRLEAAKFETTLMEALLSARTTRITRKVTVTSDGYRLDKTKRLFPEGITASPRVLSFYGSGVVTPATLRLRSHGRSCSVTLSLRGRIRTVC